MANTIKLYQYLPSIGVFDKTVAFPTPMQLPISNQIKIKVNRIQISDRIPNVFNAYPYGFPFNNTRLRVGTDVDPYFFIKLDPGLYFNAAVIEAAINKTLNSLGWWTDPTNPGLTILENNIIDRLVITIDSTKLAAGHGTQFYLDLRKSTTGCDMAYTLGFADTTEFTVDGEFTSTQEPQMDTQGTSCIVCCSIMPSRMINETVLPYLAEVDFAGKTTSADNIWPSGNVGSEKMVYSGPRTITQARFYVLTSTGKPMVFLSGQLSIELLFYW